MTNEPDFRDFRAFGVWLQTPLSRLLHDSAAVRCVGRRELPFSAISGPVFFFRLTGQELPEETILGFEFASPLFFSLLDRLQGGSGELDPEAEFSRLTPLERRLAARFILLFQNAIRETWNFPEGFDFEPLTSLNWGAEHTLNSVEFRMDIGVSGGTFRIWFPISVRKQDEIGMERGMEEEVSAAESLAEAPVRVSVQLAGESVAPKALMHWHVGDVIPLGRPEDFPFTVLIEGMEKFAASPGRYKSRKAFRILSQEKSENSKIS